MDAIDFFNGTAGAAYAAPAVPLKHMLFSSDHTVYSCRQNGSMRINDLSDLFTDHFFQQTNIFIMNKAKAKHQVFATRHLS